MKLWPKTATALLLIGLFGGLANAQLRVALSGEAGYFQGNGFENTRSHLAYRIDSRANYQFKHHQNHWLLKLRYRPRFYGIDRPTRISKFSAEGAYWNRSSKLRWGILLNRQFYSYHNPAADLGFDIMQIQGALMRNIKPDLAIAATVRYYYRDLDAAVTSSLDGIIGEGRLTKALGRHVRITAAMNLERFFIDQRNNPAIGRDAVENSGWRFGPLLAYMFEKRFLFQLQYRYLFQKGEIQSDFAGEHWVRMLFGKILNARWSIFFLLDAYSRNSGGRNNDGLNAGYSPLNTESSLYGKIEYKLGSAIAIFLKAEYTRDELQFPSLTLTSRQFTAGLAFTGR